MNPQGVPWLSPPLSLKKKQHFPFTFQTESGKESLFRGVMILVTAAIYAFIAKEVIVDFFI